MGLFKEAFGNAYASITPMQFFVQQALAAKKAGYYLEGTDLYVPPELMDRAKDSGSPGVHQLVAQVQWADCGFPRVELSAKLAASFAATTISTVEDVVRPWLSFLISLPPGVLHHQSPVSGVEEDVTLIVVARCRDASELNIMAYTGVGPSMVHFPHRATCLQELCEDYDELSPLLRPEDMVDPGNAVTFPETSEDARVMRCAGRIVLSTMLELANRGVTGSSYKSLSAESKKRVERGKLPQETFFKLTRDVQVDCREAVRAYIRGNGKSPTVRWLTRGHWRNQACGPKLAERKRIHVEPYWSNRDCHAVASRAHILK